MPPTLTAITRCWFYAVLTCALVLAAAAAPAADEAAAAREQFKKAYNSMRAGNVTLANKQAAGLANHPLYLYVRYAYLQPRLHRVGAGEVRDFLSAYEGSVMAERLRTAWLQHLGRKRSWDAYLDAYRPQDDAALECLHWQARQKTGNSEGLLVDARRLWLVGRSQPDECDPVFATLAASPEMTDELLIARLTLAMHENQSGLGRYLAGRIRDPELKRVAGKWYAMHHNPDRYLKDPALKADTPLTRAILAHGVRRLTRRNIDTALNRWQALSGTHAFTPAEAGVVQRDLALAANRHEHADRLRLLDGIPATAVDAVVDRARIVAALEERNWELLARWTSGAPSPDFNALRARYWHGRALEELGKTEAARLVFRELASERDYYGFRAADRLGVTYSMNDYPILVSEAERTAIMANPGVLRARELLAMDYRYMARREWHHELKKMTRRELEVAALQAHEWGWHDRAIITVGKAQAYDDLALRFPLLYQQEVEYYADKRKVGAELLYSIMRAESAFMFDARSPAGALGLMQLMPATARETARRIGLNYRGADQLKEPRINIMLGSAYLTQMIKRHGGNFAMAAAAYNAGPHRVRAWRPEQACVPEDIWIESIPFTETRRYVRRTLFFATVYEWRLKQNITTLASRSNGIPGKTGASTC